MERVGSRKRKAVTRDIDIQPAVVSGDEYEFGQLDGTLSDDDSEDDSDASADADSISLGSAESKEDLAVRSKSHSRAQMVDIKVNGQDQVQHLRPDSDEEEGEDTPNYTVVKDANGNDRYIYDEIDPGDDSDYSAPDADQNTIGNIPLSYYDAYPHIGYNINGKKIMRPARGEALDSLLDSIEIPKGWTGLTDPSTGKPLNLTQEELKILRQVQQNEIAGEGSYNPYEPTIEWFTSKEEIMPLSAAPEPKRRFVPSKHEQKRVMKLVKAIREGRIQPYRPATEADEESEEMQNYDLWENEQPRPDHAMHMPAPKLPPPGFAESYHPPPEYLPDQKERKQWEQMDEEDREVDFLPTDHSSLRKVPGYARFVKEKFDRCLDLYLAPRVRRSKLNIDPDSLLPKLPYPDELRPFPTKETTIFRGHGGRVRSVAVHPSGRFLATGSDDGTARIWTVTDARQVWSAHFSSDDAVNMVKWRPGKESILAVAVGDSLYLCAPPLDSIGSPETNPAATVLDAGWGFQSTSNTTVTSALKWTRPRSALRDVGVLVEIGMGYTPKTVSFHPAGDHLVTIQSAATVPAHHAIAIHTISKHQTQLPFKKRLKGGGTPQAAHFHPSKPVLFVANQRVIRAFDLTRQTLVKIIQPGARWISSFSLHPTSSSMTGSDNLIVASYDRRLLWMDVDSSPHPYKTLRYHQKAIRSTRFHPHVSRYPLFADCSDDGSIQIFHGLVTGDLMSNATIVPLKVLKGHKVTASGLGVLDIDWHPTEPWLFSAGADGTARLWCS